MVAAVVQHAADRELFVAGDLAAANRPHKIGYLSRQECPLWVDVVEKLRFSGAFFV